MEIMKNENNDSTIDLSEDITQHIIHLQYLLHAPRENIQQ
jgi:hypothetical protein